ncbi:patatin-like phospholipase family protein [Larsenimonas rhizosphaerae]|uniref:patatin-like phospholipase family protein n=1 Tax=Larsenimonas rhizosphaerae TaxID=2944682 RepID=UPI002033A967|nr:patatin-like phospholipase family protein [Larsenimonas rhizosphaerae]MCM2131538.1 patatin-like phospholipase family protein [Larsenimonas rhizosphaerae]
MSRAMNILLLQGGGALGAYQVGVYEALNRAGIRPDWVVGTSVGALNGALIAGGDTEHSLQRLEAFWEEIAQPGHSFGPQSDRMESQAARYMALTRGVPNFFTPRRPWSIPLLHPNGTLPGFYDTSALRATLNRLVDFDALGTRNFHDGIRLSVGAVNVGKGELTYFDSHHHPLNAEHIMASGALPPGFPPVEVDGELYWDGGLVSNTPLDYVLEEEPPGSNLPVNCYVVDLWHAAGPAPSTIMEAINREKDIQYATRAGQNVHFLKRIHALKAAIRTLSHHLPEEVRHTSQISEILKLGLQQPVNIVRLLAPVREQETAQKDIDFSWSSIVARRQAGHDDMTQALDICPCHKDPVSDDIGARVCSFRSNRDGQLVEES